MNKKHLRLKTNSWHLQIDKLKGQEEKKFFKNN